MLHTKCEEGNKLLHECYHVILSQYCPSGKIKQIGQKLPPAKRSYIVSVGLSIKFLYEIVQ